MIPKKPEIEKKKEAFIKKANKNKAGKDETQVKLTVRIPQSFHDELKFMAVSERRFVRDIVIDALQLYANSRKIKN